MNILLLGSFVALFNPIKPIPVDTAIHSDSTNHNIVKISGRYLTQVKRKSDYYGHRADKHTSRVLARFIRQEERMQTKLMRTDSTAANRIFSHSILRLKELRAGINHKVGVLSSNTGDSYTDSLQNTIKFLRSSNSIVGSSGSKLASTAESVTNLQNSLQQADYIENYMREQRQLLKAQLSNYTAFSKDLTSLNKEVYYYGQQLNEYKTALSDKKKAEEKALATLKTLPQYNDFIKANSRLAGLFGLISVSTNSPDLSGLQTRNQTEQLIARRIGSDPGAQNVVTQQLAQAKAQISELKNKYPNIENASDMPDFKPNPMKTKSIWQRLEFGGNIQFQKSNYYFPATSDISGQIGYKFHKNGSVGLGVSYKLGMGKGWDHIAFTHEGIGLRSYIDFKLKGTFYLNGGFEENYLSSITHLYQIKDLTGWQGSALVGVSKKYKVNAKLNGNLLLLYDFLASKNFPATSSIKLRFGYTL